MFSKILSAVAFVRLISLVRAADDPELQADSQVTVETLKLWLDEKTKQNVALSEQNDVLSERNSKLSKRNARLSQGFRGLNVKIRVLEQQTKELKLSLKIAAEKDTLSRQAIDLAAEQNLALCQLLTDRNNRIAALEIAALEEQDTDDAESYIEVDVVAD